MFPIYLGNCGSKGRHFERSLILLDLKMMEECKTISIIRLSLDGFCASLRNCMSGSTSVRAIDSLGDTAEFFFSQHHHQVE